MRILIVGIVVILLQGCTSVEITEEDILRMESDQMFHNIPLYRKE